MPRIPPRRDPYRALAPDLSLADALMAAFQPEEYDASLMAKTALGEARGEGDHGIDAVMNVIANRLEAKPGASIEDVVKAPKQFSAWNPGDPNLEFMQGLSQEDIDEIAGRALQILGGRAEDPTGGATHYFAPAALEEAPGWAGKLTKTASIGGHEFFKKPARGRP